MFATITFILVMAAFTLKGELDLRPKGDGYLAVINLTNTETDETYRYITPVDELTVHHSRAQIEKMLRNLLSRWAFTMDTTQCGIILKLSNGSKQFAQDLQAVSQQGGA